MDDFATRDFHDHPPETYENTLFDIIQIIQGNFSCSAEIRHNVCVHEHSNCASATGQTRSANADDAPRLPVSPIRALIKTDSISGYKG